MLLKIPQKCRLITIVVETYSQAHSLYFSVYTYVYVVLTEILIVLNNATGMCHLEIYFPYFISGFGGLGVACWPLVPKFVGSNPAEAIGFLRAKKSSACLPLEGK